MVYLVLAPRTYKADALLRIDKNKALLAAPLRSEANGAPTEAESPRAQREVEILRSRSVLGKVVEDLNLMVEYSPYYFPIIGETLARRHDVHDGIAGAWWGFGRWAWGGEKLKIATFTVPDRYLDKEFTLIALEEGRFRLLGPKDEALVEGQIGEIVTADMGEQEPVVIKIAELAAHPGTHFELTRKTSLAAIETLQKAFFVKEVSKDTDILSVELKGRDPEQLAKSVNDIATIYVNATVNWESAEASQKLGFLESQLPVVKERLEKAEQGLSALQATAWRGRYIRRGRNTAQTGFRNGNPGHSTQTKVRRTESTPGVRSSGHGRHQCANQAYRPQAGGFGKTDQGFTAHAAERGQPVAGCAGQHRALHLAAEQRPGTADCRRRFPG